MWSDVCGLVDLLIETGICDFPFHFCEGGAQEESLQLVHHHCFCYLDEDLLEGDCVHVRLFLSVLGYLFY